MANNIYKNNPITNASLTIPSYKNAMQQEEERKKKQQEINKQRAELEKLKLALAKLRALIQDALEKKKLSAQEAENQKKQIASQESQIAKKVDNLYNPTQPYTALSKKTDLLGGFQLKEDNSTKGYVQRQQQENQKVDAARKLYILNGGDPKQFLMDYLNNKILNPVTKVMNPIFKKVAEEAKENQFIDGVQNLVLFAYFNQKSIDKDDLWGFDNYDQKQIDNIIGKIHSGALEYAKERNPGMSSKDLEKLLEEYKKEGSGTEIDLYIENLKKYLSEELKQRVNSLLSEAKSPKEKLGALFGYTRTLSLYKSFTQKEKDRQDERIHGDVLTLEIQNLNNTNGFKDTWSSYLSDYLADTELYTSNKFKEGKIVSGTLGILESALTKLIKIPATIIDTAAELVSKGEAWLRDELRPRNLNNAQDMEDRTLEHYHSDLDKVIVERKDKFEDRYKQKVKEYLDLHPSEALLMEKDMLRISEEVSPEYAKEKGTYLTELSRELKRDMLAAFVTRQELYGMNGAILELGTDWKNHIGETMTASDKWGKTAKTFAASAVADLASLVVSTVALPGLGSDGYMNAIVNGDNYASKLLRWATDLQSTGCFDPENLKLYKEKGWNDALIYRTEEDENSWFSINDLYESVGQYGFTAATTIASLGGAALLKGATKVAANVAMRVAAKQISKQTGKQIIGNFLSREFRKDLAKGAFGAEGRKILERGLKLKQSSLYYGNLAVSAWAGLGEGLLEALGTYDTWMEDHKDLIDALEKLKTDVLNNVNSFVTDDEAKQHLIDKGITNFDDKTIQEAKKEIAIQSIQLNIDALLDGGVKAALMNYISNSVINGTLNVFGKELIMSRDARIAARRLGGRKNGFWDNINVVREGKEWKAVVTAPNGWKAKAKAFLSKSKDIAKTTFSEGMEEYTQNISDNMSRYVVDLLVLNYLKSSYNPDTRAAFAMNYADMIGDGMSILGDLLVDKDNIKAFILGAVSTLIGGVSPTGLYTNARLFIHNAKTGEYKEAIGRAAFDIISMPFEGSLLNGVRENRGLEKANLQILDLINSFIGNSRTQAMFDGLSGMLQSKNEVEEALQRGDVIGAEDGLMKFVLSNIVMMDLLKDTEFGKSWFTLKELLGTLNDILDDSKNTPEDTSNPNITNKNFDAEGKYIGGEQWILDLITTLKNQDGETSRTENLSDKQRLLAIADRVSLYNKIYNQYLLAKAKAADIFGTTDIDPMIMQSFAYLLISNTMVEEHLQNLKERYGEDDLSIAFNEAMPSLLHTTEEHNAFLLEHGTLNKAKAKLLNIEELIASTLEVIDNNKKQYSKEQLKATKKTLDSLKNQKKILLNQIQEETNFQEEAKLNNLETKKVIDSVEIGTKSLEETAEIVLNKNKYSKEQQQVIDEYLERTVKRLNSEEQLKQKKDPSYRALTITVDNVLQDLGSISEYKFRQQVYAKYLSDSIKNQDFVDRYAMDLRNANRKAALEYKFRNDLEIKSKEDENGNTQLENFTDYIERVSKLKEEVAKTDRQDALLLDLIIKENRNVKNILENLKDIDEAVSKYAIRRMASNMSQEAETALYKKLSAVRILLKASVEHLYYFANYRFLLDHVYDDLKNGNWTTFSHILQELKVHIMAEGGKIETVNAIKHWNEQLAKDRQTEWFDKDGNIDIDVLQLVMQDAKEVLFDYFKSKDPDFTDMDNTTEETEDSNNGTGETTNNQNAEEEQKRKEEEEYKRKASLPDPKVDTTKSETEKPYIEVSTELNNTILDILINDNFRGITDRALLEKILKKQLEERPSFDGTKAVIYYIASGLAVVQQGDHVIGFITEETAPKSLNLHDSSIEYRILLASSDKNHTNAVKATPMNKVFKSELELKEWVDDFANREHKDKFEYDNNGTRVGPKDANGFAVTLSLDALGNSISVSDISLATDSEGNRQTLELILRGLYSQDFFKFGKWLLALSKTWKTPGKWKYFGRYINKENPNPQAIFNMLFGDFVYLGTIYREDKAHDGQVYLNYKVNQEEFKSNALDYLDDAIDEELKSLILGGFVTVLEIGVKNGHKVPIFIPTPTSLAVSINTLLKCIFYSLALMLKISSEFPYFLPLICTTEVNINNTEIQNRAKETQRDVLNALIEAGAILGYHKDSVNRRVRLENPNFKPSSKTSQVDLKQGDNDSDANRKSNTKEGKDVDTASGTFEDGSNPKTDKNLKDGAEAELNEAQKKALNIVDKIVNRSKRVSLADSNADFYEDDKGNSYGRVTSREKATTGNEEEIDWEKEKEAKSNFKRDVATIYGNTMDFFTRSLIRILNDKKKAGTLEKDLASKTVVKDLLNALINDEQVKNEAGFLKNGQLRLPMFGRLIRELVTGLVDTYQSLGNWNIVPIDVKAFGGIKVQQGGLEIGYLNTAGTLDLLAYDETGTFHIIDMKTIYNGGTEAVRLNMKKGWQALVDTYLTLLLQEYPDMKFGSNYILPFSVNYNRTNRGGEIETYDTSRNDAPLLTTFSLIKNENSVDDGFTYLHLLEEHKEVTYDYDRLSPEDLKAIILDNPATQESTLETNTEEQSTIEEQPSIENNELSAEDLSNNGYSKDTGENLFNDDDDDFSRRASEREAPLIEFTNKNFVRIRNLKVNVISKIKTAVRTVFSSKLINEAFRLNLANIFFNGDTYILNYVCKNKEASSKELVKSMKQYFSFYVLKGQQLKLKALENYRIKKALYEFATDKISESELQEVFDTNEIKPSSVSEYVSYLNSSNKEAAKEILKQLLEVSNDYSLKSFKESMDLIDKTYKDMQTKLDFLNSHLAISLFEEQRKQITLNLKENKVLYLEDKTKTAPVRELLKTKKGKYSSIALLRSVIAKSSNPSFKNLASFLLLAVKRGEMNISIEVNKLSIEIEGVSQGLTISINESSLDSYEHFERVFLHEMLHSVLNISDFAKASIEEVRQLVIQSLMETTGKTENLIIKENYGLTNVNEFISEFLTNKLFQETLRTLQVENTNGLLAFINRVLNMFRMSPYKKAVNAINQVLQELNVRVLKEQLIKEEKAFDKLTDTEKELIGKRGISEKEFNRLPSKIQELLKECCR